ncbi:MAG: glycosyltransferase family 4 protein [Butyrivibrio sp.]|nr:glycosyltransferase family 4 protein [Butyrivibrio sp.]
MKADRIKVLMVGPDRSVHGGISAMVNGYYEAGLDRWVNLKYIGTMKEGSRGRKLMVAVAAYLKFVMALNSCDVVHVNAASDNSFMRKSLFVRAARLRGKKIVLHQHGGDFKNYYANEITDRSRKYIKDTLDMADIMLVLTPSWKEYFGALTDESKIKVLPNGVMTRKKNVKNRSDGEDERHGGPGAVHDVRKILFLGRICRDKGMDELFKALDFIHEKEPGVCLYIGGIYEDPSYREEIVARADYVRYIGWIAGEEKEQYLEECGILVLPSYYEGLPVTVLEAMNSGLVVVATKVGGIPEIVEDGRDGILVPPKDADALKEALLKVIRREYDTDALLSHALETVRNKYSIEHCIEELVEVYKSLC